MSPIFTWNLFSACRETYRHQDSGKWWVNFAKLPLVILSTFPFCHWTPKTFRRRGFCWTDSIRFSVLLRGYLLPQMAQTCQPCGQFPSRDHQLHRQHMFFFQYPTHKDWKKKSQTINVWVILVKNNIQTKPFFFIKLLAILVIGAHLCSTSVSDPASTGFRNP